MIEYSTERPVRLWIVNQYAVRSNEPGITRHADLAAEMVSHGVETTIIASPRNHMTSRHSVEQRGADRSESTHFVWLEAPDYTTNGIQRILNMAVFAVKAVAIPTTAIWRGQSLRPDVILGSSPSIFAAGAAWALSKALKVPFVLEVRDIYPKSIVALGHVSETSPVVFALGALEKFLYNRAQLIVSPLQMLGNHVEKRIGRRPGIRWIPNFTDQRRYVGDSHSESNGDGDGVFRVVYTGTHGLANALDSVVNAAEILKDDPVHFHLYGSGVEKPSLQAQAEALNLDNVTFHDPVPKSEVYRVQQSADALLMVIRDSPLWEDGFSPNKLYDYLGSGRPTIFASSVTHNPVKEAGAGITVPPEQPAALAEGILTLMRETPAERDAMGERGMQVVSEKYSLPAVARNFAEALRGVVRK